MFKLFMRANHLYSILWIICTGKNKFQYRDESQVHRFLSQKAFEMATKSLLLDK